MKVLAFGASGRIGSAIFHVLAKQRDLDVYGTYRRGDIHQHISPALHGRMVACTCMANTDAILRLLAGARPDVVINCVRLTQHRHWKRHKAKAC